MRIPKKIPGWTLWNKLRKQRLPFCCLQMCCFSPKLMRWVMWIMNFGIMTKTSLRIIMYHIFSIICVVVLIFEYGYARHPSMKSPIGPTEPWFPHDQIHRPLDLHRWLRSTNLTSNNPASTPCILGVPIWSCSWGSQNKKKHAENRQYCLSCPKGIQRPDVAYVPMFVSGHDASRFRQMKTRRQPGA